MGLYDFTVYDVINRNSRCFNRRRAWLEVKNPRPEDVVFQDAIKLDFERCGFANLGKA